LEVIIPNYTSVHFIPGSIN